MSEIVIVEYEEAEPCDLLAESKSLVARLVDTLAKRGVVPTFISAREFYAEIGDYEVEVFEGAVKWLIAEGVVREAEQAVPDDEDDRLLWHHLVLTSFGFRAIDRRIISELSLSSGRDPDRPDRAGIGDLIGGVLGGFTKSITSA